MRIPLKVKATLLIVIATLILSVVAGISCNQSLRTLVMDQYATRSTDIARTIALTLDPDDVRAVRDAVLRIYAHTPNKVSSESWGTPEFEAYLANYDEVQQLGEFIALQKQLRTIQDANQIECVYLLYPIKEDKVMVYLVDASYEDNSAPGCFDLFTDLDYETMDTMDEGFTPDITHTTYGWLIASGMPVHADDGTIVGYACVDYSMYDLVAKQRETFIATAMIVGAVALACIVLATYLVGKLVVGPINALTAATIAYRKEETLTHHAFENLSIHTRDEIELLAESMALMEVDLNERTTRLLSMTEELATTKEYASEMDHIARRDALTQTLNKRAYDIEAMRINRLIQDGDHAFGVIMVDLNYLKTINDTYGHDKGDVALTTLSRIIRKAFANMRVYRTGGDEFVLLVCGDNLQGIEERIADFNRTLEKSALDESLEPWEHVSAAIGFARFDSTRDETIESTFQRADEAMYARKKAMKAARA